MQQAIVCLVQDDLPTPNCAAIPVNQSTMEAPIAMSVLQINSSRWGSYQVIVLVKVKIIVVAIVVIVVVP